MSKLLQLAKNWAFYKHMGMNWYAYTALEITSAYIVFSNVVWYCTVHFNVILRLHEENHQLKLCK